MRPMPKPTAAALLCTAMLLASCLQPLKENPPPVEQQAPPVDEPKCISDVGDLVDVMLVVDKSGSMLMPMQKDEAACWRDGVYDPAFPGCQIWSTLIHSVAGEGGLLSLGKGVARFGLTLFPSGPQDNGNCRPGQVNVLPTEDFSAVEAALRAAVPLGGTPTTKTLNLLADDAVFPAVPGRQRLVVLLTDGLPNCNDANAQACLDCEADPAACLQFGGCYYPQPPGYCATHVSPGAGCLDAAHVVESIARLREKGIDTVVIGMGEETRTDPAMGVLNAAADAGGRPRKSSDGLRYYQANHMRELLGIFQSLTCKGEQTIVPTTCQDTDESSRFNAGSVSGLDADGAPYTRFDVCNAAETQVEEQWCYEFPAGSGNLVDGVITLNCPNGCRDGACLPPATPLVGTCEDTDAFQPFQLGEVSGLSPSGAWYRYADQCSPDGTSVVEQYCQEWPPGSGQNQATSLTFKCPTGVCLAGTCLK